MTRPKRTTVFLAVLALACALALGAMSAAYAEGAEDDNAVGKTFTLGDSGTGTLEFSITAVAEEGAPGTVRLVKGTTYKGSLVLDPVEHEVGGKTFTYAVTAVGADAFKGSMLLTDIEFHSDLTGASPAIGANAFEQCRNLESVKFPQKVAGIGASAFLRCTSLSSVTFAEGAELYIQNDSASRPALGVSAFERCTALTTITIPAVTSTQRSPDYYGRYGISDTAGAPIAYSGYEYLFNPGSSVPVYRYAVASSVFKDCTLLETVVFEPSGAEWGLFAYFNQDTANPAFAGCSKLKSVVYGAEQPYYADYDRSILSGYSPTYRNVYEASGIVPKLCLYYAVDYYATIAEADASGDDGFASQRYARVEYLRGTSTAAIATGDATALVAAVYADASAYAKDGYADGVVPDPKQVAVETGLDTAESGLAWVWKLGNTQSRRAGLGDSCYAYLAPADELSAGRVEAKQIAAMYKLCGQNLSQGQEPVRDSPFDAARYDGTTAASHYLFEPMPDHPKLFLDEGETAWFTLDSSLEESFFNQIRVYAADGSPLVASDYNIAFERYDAGSKGYVSVELGTQDGPLLMTVTPGEESGYTGILQEWILVKGHAGSVRASYTTSPTDTQQAATYYNGRANPDVSPFTGPYAVAISSADALSALVAASYAGLTSAPVNVRDTEDASYGFALSTDFYPRSGEINGKLTTFPATGRSPSEFAVAAYKAFEERQRELLGAAQEAYPWGDTAVIVTPGSVQDVAAGVAAFAYAKKAPVFYTEDDGSVSEATLACLRQFEAVAVLGDEALFPADAYQALELALGSGLSPAALPLGAPFAAGAYGTLAAPLSDGADIALRRICGDAGSACSLSLTVASLLAEEGLVDSSVVTVTDATDVADVLAALNLSGHEGGLTLVSACTVDSKHISAFLRGQRDALSVVRLFGRGASHMSAAAFDLYDLLCDLWNEQGYAAPQIGEGDTLVLYGVQLTVGSGNSLAFDGVRLWGGSGLAAGSFEYGGQSYVLTEAVEASDSSGGPSDEPPEQPTEKPALVVTKPLVADPVVTKPVVTKPSKDGSTDGSKTSKPVGGLKVSTPSDKSPSGSTQAGRLVVSSPQVDSPPAARSGTTAQGSATTGSNRTGALGTSQMAIEDGEDTDALAETERGAREGNASPTGVADGSEREADQQTVTDPRAAAAIVGSALAALAAALWFALRRRKSPAALVGE
ncbi:MAG: leucine-rich repeat domain-containing protein [Coriobacteriales bacterium]|nr:leucine-rich repeat domain-containing protein [Coriobacteriales bacterium]